MHTRKYLFSSSTYSQEYLQRGVSHLYELKIHQTARYRYISVVLGCPGGRRSDGCHPAPRAILHPPGAMHGQVERQDKVRVLARKRQKETERDRKRESWITSSDIRQIRKKAAAGWMSGQVLTSLIKTTLSYRGLRGRQRRGEGLAWAKNRSEIYNSNDLGSLRLDLNQTQAGLW